MAQQAAEVVIRLSELLGKEVVTESGWSLGSVYDVRVALRHGEPKVLGLVVGPPGLGRRLLGETRRQDASLVPQGLVPWQALQSVDQKTIRVAEVATPQTEEERA
jgi:sporulation protein YlmC with PRC-barrel domain